MTRPVPAEALALMAHCEGLRLAAYDDATGHVVPPGGTVKGKLTIGRGHTGPDVTPGLTITTARADALFAADVAARAPGLHQSALEDRIDLNDSEFGALLSFAYNLGLGTLIASSIWKALRLGVRAAAADAFRLYDKTRIDGHLVYREGLAERRAREAAMFRGENWRAAFGDWPAIT